MKPIKAYVQATLCLTNMATGCIDYEITAKNKLNSDYAAEIKNIVFSSPTPMTVYLSDYEQPAPENGLIFPMGHFLGYGKYAASSNSIHQGAWSPNISTLNKELNGYTQSTFVWDFKDEQAVGTIRSLFLYWDTFIAARYPALIPPAPITWKGSPRWSVENKLLDIVAKTDTTYTVADYYSKQIVSHTKENTLTLSGIARDVDNGHILIFDEPEQKLYEFASLDVDMVTPNIISAYPCTKANFGKGIVKNGNLFYISSNMDPLSTDATNPTGTELYLFQYAYETDSVPVHIDTISCAEVGITKFQSGDPCAFIDDYLIHHNAVSGNYPAPVLHIVGNTAKIGFTGVSYYASSINNMVQRPSPNRQLLMSGNHTANLVRIPPMSISHLLLPTPIVKDDQHRLAVSYTLSIQD